jgi:cytochrome c biogenesis protein CcmG/thiol:disulfide interchange protein DsbE
MTKNQTESLHATRAGNVPALLMPLLLFAGVVVVLAIGLSLDPREVPSPLIGKPVPEFALPPVKGRTLGLSGADLKGEVSLVNVFASWCVACRDEHPILMNLRSEGFVPIHGLNYKDRPEDAARWLDTLGDPYARTGADLDGRVGIDWGVYGVPETFVVDRDGRIAYKFIGPVTPEVLEQKLRPLIAGLRTGGAPAEVRLGGSQ